MEAAALPQRPARGELTGEKAATFFELFTLGQPNDEIADALRAGHEAGAFELRAPAGDLAAFLIALADGVTIRRLSEPALEIKPLMDQAVAAARALLA